MAQGETGRAGRWSGAAAFAAAAWSVAAAGAELPPLPADVPGHKACKPGEHPRLFFRRADLPRLRQRAETPEGKAILKRLRFLLDGSNGEGMPTRYNPVRESKEGSGAFDGSAPFGGTYTLWHGAGYGMLYQLTGEKKYADLGRQCVARAFQGQRDRDNRYSFRGPYGALRAGPSLSAIAMAYDLCYDGWDEAFRRKVLLEIQNYDEHGNTRTSGVSLELLARGSRLGPTSNHWGPQIGGASLALLAIRGDGGADEKKVEALLATNAETIPTQLARGWGSSGWFSQGDGAGSICSDTAFGPALQAWKVAAGKDYITPRPNAQWMTLKWIMGTVRMGGGVYFPARQMYTHNAWARRGLSGSGTFAQGFGMIDEKYKPALLWLYNHFFKADDERAGAPFDTVSPYPHRAVLAFVNWPLGLAEKNPVEVFGHVSGGRTGYIFCRNQWKDETDVMVSLKAGLADQIAVFAHGMRLIFGQLPGATLTYYRQADDGSVVLSNPKGRTFLAVDFSGACGAELLIAIVGKGARAGKDAAGTGGASATFHTLQLGGYHYVVLTLQTGRAPQVKVAGGKIVAGGQTIHFDGRWVHLGKMAPGPPAFVAPDVPAFTPADDQRVRDEPRVQAEQQAERHRQQLAAQLARLKALIADGKLAEARKLALELSQGEPESPQGAEAGKLIKQIDQKILWQQPEPIKLD